ncbi:MAG: hypothetical protein DCC49_02140 [Acidobacteria bacterium]|nr:MAG: hypothetical protein DCC49_02140 [Acidobacteriota bacterium]
MRSAVVELVPLVVVDRLSRTPKPEASEEWLFSPNPSLDYERPADMLKDGNYRGVLGAIDALGRVCSPRKCPTRGSSYGSTVSSVPPTRYRRIAAHALTTVGLLTQGG